MILRNKLIKIGPRFIGPGQNPYIIAEMSANHNGSIDRAFSIMEEAKKAGADAIKIQTYTADSITIDHDGPEFIVDLPLWNGQTLYNLYEDAHTPWEWHEPLFKKGRELGITVFSSPFDFAAVDFLEKLNAPAYKIASSELVDIPLIEKVASTGKPLIISTGMGTVEEIADAVKSARNMNCKDLILLHCVAAYPTPYEDVNLGNIQVLAKKFNVLTGLSDHTLGTVVASAATAMKATVIEKHFTLSRDDGGVDSAFSIEPSELRNLVDDTRIITASCKESKIGPKQSEKQGLKYRRSLYIVEDINAGDRFSKKNIRSIRPSNGLRPKYYNSLLKCTASRSLEKGEALTWDMVSGEIKK